MPKTFTKESTKKQYKKICSFFKKSPLYQKLLSHYNYQRVRGYCTLEKLTLAVTFLAHGEEEILPSSCDDPRLTNDQNSLTGVAAAFSIIRHHPPVYWLEKRWLKMMLNTALPSVIDDLKMPFSEALLLFPENLILSPDQLPLEWLYFKYFSPGEKWEDVKIQLKTGQITTISGVSVATERIVWITSIHGLIYRGSQEIKNKELIRGELEIVDYNLEASDKKKEEDFIIMINDLIIKLLLFIQIQPDGIDGIELIKTQNIPQNQSRNRTTTNRKKAPQWIGKRYESALASKTVGHSFHASPRTHFRRGHMRRVAIGQGRTARKWVWIEPTLVN